MDRLAVVTGATGGIGLQLCRLLAKKGYNLVITGRKEGRLRMLANELKALQSIGYETIASGDSYNDLGMIQASKAGFLFKSTEKIKADYPNIPAYEEFDELLEAIKKAL